jgi:thioredoxin reductase (NADPH)
MGISRNRLGLKNEKELVGNGISYCVDCDAGFFKDSNVAVVGSESAAVSGALTLLFFADTVHLVCETLNINPVLAEKLKESSVIVHQGCKAKTIIGETSVQGLVLDNGTQIEVNGLFIELGAKGAISLASSLGVALDPSTMKFIQVNRKQETNIPGIYAAGDICGPPWQIAKAVGEGCVAGLEAASYAKKKQ